MTSSKKKTTTVIFISFCIVLIGAFLASAIIGIYQTQQTEIDEEKAKIDEYSKQLESLEEEKIALEAEIDALDEKYSGYLDELVSSDEDYYNLVKRYDDLNAVYKFYSGMTDVSGEGIRFFLDDGESLDGTVTSFMVVHDSTLIRIVEALKCAGAQAISINGERIVSMTDIVCVGPSIRVNGKKLFAPFDIKAIGDSDKLYDGFTGSDVYASIMYSELKYDISKSEYLLISGYSGVYENDVDRLVD